MALVIHPPVARVAVASVGLLWGLQGGCKGARGGCRGAGVHFCATPLAGPMLPRFAAAEAGSSCCGVQVLLLYGINSMLMLFMIYVPSSPCCLSLRDSVVRSSWSELLDEHS